MDLLLDAVVLGVLLGCFYAAVSLGLSVSFGLLDVPHVAHPAFLVLASYAVFFLNDNYEIDPLLAGLLITPLLFVFGLVAYRIYYETFERRGSDAGVRGIAFFFGVAFIIEVLIILHFGVDQRSVTRVLYRQSLALRRHADSVPPDRGLCGRGGLTVLLALYLSQHLHGARDPRRGPGRGGAAADGRQSRSASSNGHSASRPPCSGLPARSSSSSRRSIRRSTAPISDAPSASSSWRGSAA